MNKIYVCFSLVFVLAAFSYYLRAEEPKNTSELKAEAKEIVAVFAGNLKPKLKKAIQDGGFEHAVNICSVEAPKIAKNLSAKTGWSVKRVNLKPRNINSATPDEFEREVLRQFNERQIKGESPPAISYAEIVGDKFRFMKAQGVEGLCLNCHGTSIQPDVKKLILEHYPDDAATGYSLGEIRGAFSLIKSL
ncbi:MAG: DUF3365 domain-containing protein [Pseudomonadales bacterium]|nr:DUF3365 domain-containing protein [Pseudomonadales bacterium]